MDSQIDVEALRKRLVALGRKRTRELAKQAGLACETVDKFRRNHIREPRLSKLQALIALLPPEQEPTSKNGRTQFHSPQSPAPAITAKSRKKVSPSPLQPKRS